MVLWGKGRELQKILSVGVKPIEGHEDPTSFDLPVYISPSHEPIGAQK